MNWGQFNAAGAAFVAGQQINQKLELGAEEIAQAKQQTAAMQMSNMAKQQQQQNQQQMAQWMKANFDSKQALAAAPEEQAKLFGQAANEALKRGDFAGAEKMQELAKSKMEDAKQVRLEQVAQQAQGQEELAKLAMEAEASPTQENAMALVQKAVQQGEDPSKIPPPNTPAFSAWVKNKETGSMTAKDRLAALEKKREFDDQEKDRREKAKRDQETELERLRERAEDRRMSRQMQQEGLELRKMMVQSTLDARAEKKADMETYGSQKSQDAAESVVGYAAEITRSMKLVGALAQGVTVGNFNDMGSPEGILQSLSREGTNRATPEQSQIYQTAMGAADVDIANIATGGKYKASVAQIAEAKKMVEAHPGDTQLERAFRVANALEFTKTRLESLHKVRNPEVRKQLEEVKEAMKKFPSAESIAKLAQKKNVKLDGIQTASDLQKRFKDLELGEDGGGSNKASPASAASAANRPAEINDIMKKLGY